jgi:hypothetical protein
MNIVVVSQTRKILFVGLVNQIDREYIGNFKFPPRCNRFAFNTVNVADRVRIPMGEP